MNLLLVSFQINFVKSNILQHASSSVQLLYVVFCEIIRKLLNFLIIVQALSEMKIEILKITIFTLGIISSFDQ